MLTALILAAAATSPIDAFVSKACLTQMKPDDNNPDMKAHYAQDVECYQGLMNTELDAFLLPLKKKDHDAFTRWMKVQASFNRWVKAECGLSEEIGWADLSSHDWSDGTARGMNWLSCQAAAFSARAFFAHSVAAGDLTAFVQFVDSTAKESAKSRKVWDQQVASAQLPPTGKPEAPDAARWDALVKTLNALAPSTKELAHEQCEALPKESTLAGPRCEERMALWLYSVLVTPEQN